MAAACSALCLTGCGNSNSGSDDEAPAEREAKFDSDLLCGFSFYPFIRTGFSSPVEELNKSLESGEAVASYFIEEYVEGPHGGYINLKRL